MTSTTLPLVSVCIPSYNRAERLRRAVEKLLAGTYPNLEIIISDNASTDHTPEVCAALRAASPRVRVFRHAENHGMTRNFEFARSQATGKYFLWHGDDDYISPDYIALCVAELERDPALVLASGLAAYHRGDEVVVRHGNVIDADGRWPWLRALRYLFTVEENSIFCAAYRREALAHCRLPNFLAGDWAWLAEVLAEGPGRVLPQALVHREESDNTSRSVRANVAAVGGPPWQARHPWLAIPLNVANYLGFQASRARAHALPVRLARWMGVFTVLLVKRVLLAVGPHIPLAGRAYRRVFGSRAQPPGP